MVRFLNSRATMKRISDGALIYGWVLESRIPGQIMIKVTKGDIALVQEPYELTLNSRLGGLVMTCVLGALNGDCATFAIPKVVEIAPPAASSRMKTPPYEVCVGYDGKNLSGTMLDIANAGIGVRTTEAISKGVSARIEILAAFGRKSIVGVTAYSKPFGPMDPGWFRVGFRVDADNRLSQANWKHIFDFVVEQALIESQHQNNDRGLSAWRRAS